MLCADISAFGCMHHGHMSFIWRVIVVVVAVVTTTTTQQSFAPQCVFGLRDIFGEVQPISGALELVSIPSHQTPDSILIQHLRLGVRPSD